LIKCNRLLFCFYFYRKKS
ncbi:hypothetical protein D043_4159B, partial [Vibrio parahaemolyticus EKP-021]